MDGTHFTRPLSGTELDGLFHAEYEEQTEPNVSEHVTTPSTPPDDEPTHPNPFTEKQQDELAKYRTAHEQEFTRSNKEVADTASDVRKILLANGQLVASKLVALAAAGSSEAIRLNAGRYILDRIEEMDAQGGSQHNPLQNLFDRLQATDSNNPNEDPTTEIEDLEQAFQDDSY